MKRTLTVKQKNRLFKRGRWFAMIGDYLKAFLFQCSHARV